MALQYWNGGAWADYADGSLSGSYQGGMSLDDPLAAARDGDDAPCGAIGLPEIVINCPWMTGTGMAFWQALFASRAAESVAFDTEVYDTRTGTTTKWSGTLLRPTWQTCSIGSTQAKTVYRGVRIVIENCAASAH